MPVATGWERPPDREKPAWIVFAVSRPPPPKDKVALSELAATDNPRIACRGAAITISV
jgi:hypothetical protein